jgi:hypothetical protein
MRPLLDGGTLARAMTVSIPCASCSQQRACPACSRPVSSDETAALESRFEATHVDFRDAKAVVLRGLTAALVAGLITMAIAGLRVLLTSNSSETGIEAPPLTAAVADLLFGLSLIACWIGRHRFPALASITALLIWSASLLAPFLASPALAVLGIASPTGIALTLARLAVLGVLARGVPASLQLRRFVASAG